ncbi:hypothetical protein BST20_06260 [Mycobacterium branderi]|uniref:Carbon monoxide dehydrogenase subunit G n=1 Tax=Mycobacterium branderi TaxID=43348 RepID=A0AA91LYX7_9MYCO|nr:hypothetical protein BST20_06260 [Mycobacterium branderi]
MQTTRQEQTMSEKMIIKDRVDTPLSPQDLFALLTDLDAVVPCVPGAILHPDEGGADGVRKGQIVIAFGPIRYRYEGTVRSTHVDAAKRTVTYEAAGTETSGEGTVGGELTLNVAGTGGESTLDVLCEAQVTGMVADYGQDMAEEVARDIIRQFANAVRERHESSGADAADDEQPKARHAAATPKPIGGLRLLLRITVQRILRKILGRKGSGSTARTTPDSSGPQNT